MKIETKFEIDQEVYFMKDNEVATTDIKNISIEVEKNYLYCDKVTIKYHTMKIGEKITFRESMIFKDKESLLNSL